jgi:hypothetical protein
MPPAIVLLSGGLDSATALAIARTTGRPCHALSFRYGQRYQHELTLARRLATTLGAGRQLVVDIDLAQFGGSAVPADIEVPKDRLVEADRRLRIPPGLTEYRCSASARGARRRRPKPRWGFAWTIVIGDTRTAALIPSPGRGHVISGRTRRVAVVRAF